MGVRGLSTFFNQNTEFFKPYKLHDCVVVFDGDNLIHALYFNYRVNFMYGGDYKKYADSIRRYLLIYLECNIKPIIICDGGFDKSGRKLKTIAQRTKQRLSEIQYITKYGCCSGKVLPLLAREVFLSVLGELDIAFAVCDYEADDQIAALANHYKCPVISADSDFYIYDIHKGFININSIEMTVILDTDSDGKEYKFLNCNIYHIDKFVSCFPGIDKSVLPLFGTLMGNDYVEEKVFDNFFSNIQLPKYKGRKLILNSKQEKMIGLLCWLKNNTLNEAVNQVIQYLKKDKREYVRSIMKDAVSCYELRHCNLSAVIDKKIYNFKSEVCFNSRLTTPCGNTLPLDFVVKFHSGQYCSFFINVIVSHKIFLQPQVEDISFPSSYACSRYLRQLMYGILIRHDIGDKICESEKCLAFIEENDRQRKNLQKELVEPIFSLKGIGILPKVNELTSLKEEKCKLILSEALDVSSDFFLNLPDEWQLLIGTINYWLRNCMPYSTEAFIFALTINLIYFSLIKHQNSNKDNFKWSDVKCTEDTCSCLSVICILSRISESELNYAAKNLEKYVHKSVFNHGNPLILHIVHSYSQLQTCILNALTFNKLLGYHMRNPDLHKCLGGTMLYNLAKDISTRLNPRLFIAEVLGRETNLYLLFTVLSSKICQDVPSDLILKNHVSLQKQKKKSRKNLDSSSKDTEHTSANFNVLKRVELL